MLLKRGEVIEKREKKNDQLGSEFQQLKHNRYLPKDCRKKVLSLVDIKILLETNKSNKGHDDMSARDSKQKPMKRLATLDDISLVKTSASKDQIKKRYNKMSLLTHNVADAD